MVYSPTQFQKGLSLPAFLERYGTEERCICALFAARWPNLRPSAERSYERRNTK
jgi:hypothetical protein